MMLVPNAAPHKATTSPIVTGSSVLAIKYRDGVMMAADTLGSYGSMVRLPLHPLPPFFFFPVTIAPSPPPDC